MTKVKSPILYFCRLAKSHVCQYCTFKQFSNYAGYKGFCKIVKEWTTDLKRCPLRKKEK